MDELKLFVERQENCRAIWRESGIIETEGREDGSEVEREVHTFILEGHPTAKLAYVWQKESTVATRNPAYIAVLGIPPINSPTAALEQFRKNVIRNL
jgi:hypothetical protein